MHEKYGNIHYLPLYTCHPFLSLSNFPSLPEEIVNNEVLLQHIIDFQFSKIIPASKRKQFCYFRGQPTYERKKLEHLAPVTVLENGIETKKQLCKIEYTTGFAAGDKLSYSLFLANTAVILCPTGSNPDQFRVWESLENGAIPLPENLESFSGLPKNHPLPVVDVSRQEYHKKLESVLPELYSFTPQQLDELQRRLYNWWFRYKLEIGLKVAKALDA
nr:unnamed protein product [Naegleria fowleri]